MYVFTQGLIKKNETSAESSRERGNILHQVTRSLERLLAVSKFLVDMMMVGGKTIQVGAGPYPPRRSFIISLERTTKQWQQSRSGEVMEGTTQTISRAESLVIEPSQDYR